ncbi:MAG: MarR family winged helix-turn-helix transcriptional regulator [Hyphomonadaceae bacterium]|nr:MarR family winged helix-turn-helix transcriptional regulator [Hyphomonadaceae bacterium]
MSEADTQDNGQGTFDLTTSLSHLLHRAQQLAANESAAALREAGVTLRQFNVLAAASQEDGPSQSRLVELTGIDRSTLADMLNRMESSGLIIRKPSPEDARAKSVALTEEGEAALAVAGPAVQSADESLIKVLAKNRRAAFIDLLTVMIDSKSEGKPLSALSAHAEPEAEPVAEEAPKPAKKKAKEKAKEKPKVKAKAKDKAPAKKKKKKSKA